MDKLRKYSEETNPISLREERRRTGRYVAVCLAICITLLGLYQAMVQHTPVIAGLFAPAIIMFLYVFWVLYTASKTERYHLRPGDEDLEQGSTCEHTCEHVCGEETCGQGKSETARELQDNLLTEAIVYPSTSDKMPILPKDVNVLKEDNILAEKITRNKLNRTYSIA